MCRNTTALELDGILINPDPVHDARESVEEMFASGELVSRSAAKKLN